MLEEIDEVNKVNFFSQINSDKKQRNEGSVHDKIKAMRKDMRLAYEKEPYFSDIMPTINKQTKAKNMYKFLIRNGLKYHSQIIRVIFRTINNLTIKHLPKSIEKEEKKKNLYKLPKIDNLKKKKDEIDNKMKKIKLIRLQAKKFEDFKSQTKIRNLSPLTTINNKSTKSIFFNNISSKSTKNTNNFKKNFSTLNFNLNPFIDNDNENNNKKDISMSPKSDINNTNITNIKNSKLHFDSILNEEKNKSFIKSNYSQSLNIINRCNNGVKKGNRVSVDVTRYKKEFEKSLHNKIRSQDLLDLDHKVLEAEKKRINKYTKLEEQNIKSIKKQLKEKISDNFAYKNRKEFIEILKQNKNAKEYNLHLLEIDEINKKMVKRVNLERKRINKIKLMAEDEFCRSIVIKKKMDEINNKNFKIKKLNSSQDVILPEKFLIPIVKNFGLNGDLIPSIINIRNTQMKRNIKKYPKFLDKI